MSDHAAAASHDSPEELRKHIRKYWAVAMALYAGTVITVAVAWLQLPTYEAIAVALAIACTKATLVALFFMHLIDEKKLIYWTLTLTALFFALCMMLPSLTVGESLGDQMWKERTEKPLHGENIRHEPATEGAH